MTSCKLVSTYNLGGNSWLNLTLDVISYSFDHSTSVYSVTYSMAKVG